MKAVRWLAPAAALLLGGCGQEAPQAAAAASAPRLPPLPAAPSHEYRRCTAAAGPVDPARAACAEAEIGRIQAALASRWRAAGHPPAAIEAAQQDFEVALAKIAPAAASGGTLDRLLAVTRAMTIAGARAALLTGGSSPTGRAAAPLAGDAATAWKASRTSACALAAIGKCSRRYDALLAIEDTTAMPTPVSSIAIAGLPLPSCAEVAAASLSGAALADAFDRRYPKPLNDEDAIETLALAPAQIANVVGYLACVAGRTDGDVGVAETGLTLFASRRHGPGALAALDRLAESGGAEASAARDYAGQIRAYLKR